MGSRVPHVPLVLGAGGLVGSALVRVLEEAFPAMVAASRAEIDIEDRFGMEAEIERLRPSVVINCAGFVDIDACEKDPEAVRGINAEGAENVARAALNTGCRLIQISCDIVFDGSARRPYREEDPTGPLSICGASKLEGEQRVTAVGGEVLILRSAWIYGPGRANFVDGIRVRARAGGVLGVVGDQHGSPTYVVDLAGAIRRLIEIEHRGIVHFANTGGCSRYELAREIVASIGASGMRIEPIRAQQTVGTARRPVQSALDPGLYTRLTGEVPRHWRDALLDYLGRRSAGSE